MNISDLNYLEAVDEVDDLVGGSYFNCDDYSVFAAVDLSHTEEKTSWSSFKKKRGKIAYAFASKEPGKSYAHAYSSVTT